MKCEDMPQQLVSLLYGELETDVAKKIEAHIKKCPSCRNAYQELRTTTHLLEKWEDAVPKGHFVFVSEPASHWARWKEKFATLSPWSRLAVGIPAFAAVCLVFLSLLNFRASKNDNGWQFAFSLQPQKEQSYDNARILNALTQMQKETLVLTSQLIQESEDQQKREMGMQLTNYAQNWENRRQQDLRMFGRGLEGLHQFTEGRLNQTNNAINDFIQLTGYTIERE